MRYTIATKGCDLSNKMLLHIKLHVRKLARVLPEFKSSLPLLEIVMRKQRNRTFGTIKLILPKKPLVVHAQGFVIDEAINVGFDRLMREVDTYKGKHFVGDSEYFNHNSIRKAEYFRKME